MIIQCSDLLSSSEINIMEKTSKATVDQGKPNLQYKHSNVGLPCDSQLAARHNSLSNGRLALEQKKSSCNKQVPVQKTNNTTSRHDSSNLLQLVINKSQNERICISTRKSYFVLGFLLFLFLIVIITLATLYVIQTNNKDTPSIRKDFKGEKQEILPCFIRATSVKIQNIREEPEMKEAISQSFRHVLSQRNRYHSLSLNALYMGEEIWSHYGGRVDYKDTRSLPPTGDTPYPVASVTKIFTVLMLEILIERRVIKNIDDDIKSYESNFTIINSFNNDKITFRQLACMMSGLPREAPCFPMSRDNLCPYATEKILYRLRNRSLLLPPGKKASYSNLALALLGHVLENQLKNETFEQWVMKNIVEPLNMTNTGFGILNKQKELPHSTTPGGFPADILDWGWLNPSGGLYSSANDMGKLGSFFLGYSFKNQILSKIYKTQMLKKAYIWSDQSIQGCPFEIYPLDPYHFKKKQVGYIMYIKSGSIFGYSTVFSIIPELKLNINAIAASEIEGYGNYIASNMLKTFTKALDKLLKRKQTEFNYKAPPDPEQYTGTYNLTNYWPFIRKPCVIAFTNGVLRMKLEWFDVSLTHVKDHTLKVFDTVSGCNIVSTGLLLDEYVFKAPKTKGGKCDEFHVKGITAYGYARFKRIT